MKLIRDNNSVEIYYLHGRSCKYFISINGGRYIAYARDVVKSLLTNKIYNLSTKEFNLFVACIKDPMSEHSVFSAIVDPEKPIGRIFDKGLYVLNLYWRYKNED